VTQRLNSSLLKRPLEPLEDKIVQRAAVAVQNAVWETDFMGFSYGYRPGRSAHRLVSGYVTGE
jgi:RNA-directed DNA polymerase